MWKRVNRRKPCPVCGKDHWCTLSSDGAVACCMRMADGAFTNRVLNHGIGWFHRLKDQPPPPRRWHEPTAPLPINFRMILQRWKRHTTDANWRCLGKQLCVSPCYLYRMGFARQPDTDRWGVPMYDMNGRTIGVRLRTEDGRKFALYGSRSGLFAASLTLDPYRPVLICEGPTDAAAALALTDQVIGRPCCDGAYGMLLQLLEQRRVRDIRIVMDADEPGRQGAERLRNGLARWQRCHLFEPPPPHKDLRDWLTGPQPPSARSLDL